MPPPISVQSQKLIPWLVERNVISKSYMKSLTSISKKIEEFSKSSPEKIKDIEVQPVQYFFALAVLNHLEQTETTKDFLGRASASVRTWRNIVSCYESEHINLAEVSERLNDVCFQLPKCKAAIADRQKLINDLQRKVVEFTSNQQSKESELERFRKQFDIKDEHARLQLLEKASTLPDILDDYVLKLKSLSPVLDFYTAFISYVNPENSRSGAQVCSTLRLLIKCGHVTVYEWRTGNPPTSVGASDDYLPTMLERERQNVEAMKKEALIDDQEIDLGALDVESEADLSEIDFGTDLLGDIDVIDLHDVTLGGGADHGSSPQMTGKAMAVGPDARLLLDTSEGRNALINDLEELTTFLLRIKENHFDFQADDSHAPEAKKKTTGGISVDALTPIYHQIMQDAPAEIYPMSLDNLDSMSSAVQKAFDEITNETITHLALLRLQPSYLERLISRMQDLKQQADRSRAKVTELTASIDQANGELLTLHTEINNLLQERKNLVSFLESQLSKLYEREIKLVGAVA